MASSPALFDWSHQRRCAFLPESPEFAETRLFLRDFGQLPGSQLPHPAAHSVVIDTPTLAHERVVRPHRILTAKSDLRGGQVEQQCTAFPTKEALMAKLTNRNAPACLLPSSSASTAPMAAGRLVDYDGRPNTRRASQAGCVPSGEHLRDVYHEPDVEIPSPVVGFLPREETFYTPDTGSLKLGIGPLHCPCALSPSRPSCDGGSTPVDLREIEQATITDHRQCGSRCLIPSSSPTKVSGSPAMPLLGNAPSAICETLGVLRRESCRRVTPPKVPTIEDW